MVLGGYILSVSSGEAFFGKGMRCEVSSSRDFVFGSHKLKIKMLLLFSGCI